MYLLILFLPLIGSILAGILGRKLGVLGSQIITITCLIITSIFTILAFFEIISGSTVEITIINWFNIENININWGFLFDPVSISFLLAITIVSTLVHIYSTDYMKEDAHQQRFFSYLSLFTFFMIILVTGNSYLTMFVGWHSAL